LTEFYTKEIGPEICRKLLAQAQATPRLRSHQLWHRDHKDPVQRLLIAAQPGTYFRPHVHSAQWELLQPLFGEAELLTLDEQGVLMTRQTLTVGQVVELPAGRIHTLSIRQPFCFFEVKPGPFAEAKIPAWAPEETSPCAALARDWLQLAAPGMNMSHLTAVSG
jgi:cupin fold WbuC family metalloprotein